MFSSSCNMLEWNNQLTLLFPLHSDQTNSDTAVSNTN
jgi:hypothetical protein